MSAPALRRTGVVAGAAVVALVASPLVASALAATTFAPQFDGSAFDFSGQQLAFADVAARPNHAVQLPTAVDVAFPAPVKTTQGSSNPFVSPVDAAGPYFQNAAGDKIPATRTVQGSTLVVGTPTGLPDGRYAVHVSAFDADDCPDATLLDPSPSCTSYDGFVTDVGGDPFVFTVDDVAPRVTIGPINFGVRIDAQDASALAISGTAATDTRSVTLVVKSSGGTTTRLLHAPTLTTSPGADTTWVSAGNDISGMADGTLTFTAIATDWAGNRDVLPATGATRTATLATHPTAPTGVSARPGDTVATIRWAAPSYDGGHPVTGYLVAAADTTAGTAPVVRRLSCSGSVCPQSATFRHLTNGHRYALAVAAVTDVGHGAVATVATRPKAVTTLTAKASRTTIHRGRKVTLHGRLVRTATGTGVRHVTLRVKPKYGSGRVGDVVKVRTDGTGRWSLVRRPHRTVTYVVIWRGNRSTLRSVDRVRVTVRG